MTPISCLSCSCGRVRLDVTGAPIITAECHCNSCRDAAAKLAAMGVATFLEPNGGTHFVLYRKDRVRFQAGAELLREFRLTTPSKTRRVIASCCNVPVFLDFEHGHWLTLYGGLWENAARPALDLRTMTSDLPDRSVLSKDVPNAKRHSGAFFLKLMAAWTGMGFRTPVIEAGRGELYAGQR